MAALCAPAAANAATITVSTTADTSASQCTLRDAITAANSDIPFGACSSGSGTDTINITGTGTINLATALPNIHTDMTIAGPGSANLDVHRNSLGNFRIFNVSPGPSSPPNPTVTISGLTVSNGNLVGNFGTVGGGGGIQNVDSTLTLNDVTLTQNNATDTESTGKAEAAGGALYNTGLGTLTVDNSTISGNGITSTDTSSATANDWAIGEGAGIMNFGSLSMNQTTVHGNTTVLNAVKNSEAGGAISGGGDTTITQSTIDNNSVSSNSSTANSINWGGGINMDNIVPGNPHGSLTLNLDTIAGNSLGGSAGSSLVDRGGGIFIQTDGGALISSSTITGNRANDALGLGGNVTLNDPFGTHGIKNTIISDPGSNLDCLAQSGSFTSAGHNLTDSAGQDSTTCNFVAASDLTSTNPQLGALADNGGPTRTMALAANSPAVDAGTANGDTVDQRGQQRPRNITAISDSDDAADIGAFELQTTRPDKTSLDFGSQRLGHTGAAQVVTLTNEWNASVTLGTATLAGGNPSSFQITSDGCSSQVLAAGATCDITLSFITPSAGGGGTTGAKSALLLLGDNVASNMIVPLSGTATDQQASPSPSALAFSDQLIGTTSGSQNVTLSNTGGTSPLHISSIVLSGANAGEFALDASNCTTTHANVLAAGASCTIGVTFAPASPGAKSATLVMNTDGDNVLTALSGNGTAPPSTTPSGISPASPSRKCKKARKGQASAAKKKCRKKH